MRRRHNEEIRFLWLRRFAISLAVVSILGWLGVWLILSESGSKLERWALERTLDLTADLGFEVKNVMVVGRINAPAKEILNIVGINKGDPIFKFDPEYTREQLLKIDWIKKAHVERRLPDTIYIALDERKPLALWKNEESLVLIDDEGNTLVPEDFKKFKHLLMVSGQGAPKAAPELIGILEGEPAVRQRVDSAIYIEARRWDLKLNDGKIIKLPEYDMGLALGTLALSQQREKIMDRNITYIDLRDPQKLVVHTELGKVQEYKTGLAEGRML